MSDITTQTCISTRYLAAIEADDPSILPGDFFHRSFIRQYATALGLNDRDARQILDKLAPAVEIDPFPAFTHPQHIADVEQQSKPLAHIPAKGAAILLVIVSFGCAGLFAAWTRAQEAADPVLQAARNGLPEDTPSIVEASAQSLEAGRQPQETPPAIHRIGAISVKLAATEKTWVSVSSKGKTIYAGTLDATQTKDFAFEENARLLTRNAAGIDVLVNGRAIGPLGARGQSRLILLSHDKYQIIAPGKM